MKRTVVAYIMGILLFVALALVGAFCARSDGGERKSEAARAKGDVTATDEEQTVPDSIDDLLGNLDLSGIQNLINTLDADRLIVFGFDDIVERVRAVANGDIKNDYGSIFAYIAALLGANVAEFLPMMLSVIAIVLAYNILNSVKGKYASEAIERVVYFATGIIAISVVVGYFSSVLVDAVKYTSALKTHINTVAPVLVTVMTAAGATSSAGVYTPSIAVLGSGMTNVVTYIAFPALLMGLVFDIIGSVSTSLKLDKTAEFFRSACKWFLGTAFFIFVTVIGVSGITASVRDGISVRAARFAVSKYVPIIGGYLSQGFDFLMAGNVLIKNAVGASAVALIALVAAPIIARIAVFTLTLKLTAAVCEPLGGDKFGGILSSIAKSSSMVATVVVAMTILYILFLAMMICTGNIGL